MRLSEFSLEEDCFCNTQSICIAQEASVEGRYLLLKSQGMELTQTATVVLEPGLDTRCGMVEG